MKWSESTTLEFVKIYLKQECLWNPFHGAYKLKYKRENAYWVIVNEFKDFTGKIMSVPEVKNKIKNLRTTYSQEVHKILQKSSPSSIYEPSLVWFQEMDRCLKHVSYKRKSISDYKSENSVIPEVDSSSPFIWKDDPDLHNSSYEEGNPDPLVSQSLTDTEYDDTGGPDELSSTVVKIEPASHHKRKKKKLRHKPIQTFTIDSQSESLGREDEFEIYGKFIATQLRQLDLNKALKIQLAIQNLLSEARLTEFTLT